MLFVVVFPIVNVQRLVEWLLKEPMWREIKITLNIAEKEGGEKDLKKT